MISTTIIVALLDRCKKKSKFRSRLDREGRRLRDTRPPRISLQQPFLLPWKVLFVSGCEKALISISSLYNCAFRKKLELFQPSYNNITPYSESGCIKHKKDSTYWRKRSMNATDCHCLSLAWIIRRGSFTIICLLFGITYGVCSIFLRFSRCLLVRLLSKSEMARIKMPNEEEDQQFQKAINEKYSLLNCIYDIADGFKVILEQRGVTVIQELFYNGWKHDHNFTSVFVFVPNGVVISCVLNAPKSVHD